MCGINKLATIISSLRDSDNINQFGFYNHIIPSEFFGFKFRRNDMIIERINHHLIKSRRDDMIVGLCNYKIHSHNFSQQNFNFSYHDR
jgi:hypothetical protein